MEEKLKKYCTVISGYAFKSQDLSEGVDIPIIKIGNISNGENIIVDNSAQYVNKEFLSIDKKYHVLKGDILISLTGSHMNQPNSMVGRCCRNLDDVVYLLNQRAGKVIPKKTVNKDFLYYVFRLKSIQYAIANRAYGGANQVNVSPKDIMGIKFRIPNFTVQNRIADILTTYDNLIENNNKRIKLLEQMAENLYKEWFVRFRFPGYEGVALENGLPKEWEYTKLERLANISTGKCNREDAEEDGAYPLFDRSQEIKRSNVWLKDCEAIIVPGEGTSFIPRYYNGKFNLHQRCYCVEPLEKGMGFFLYQTLMMYRIYFLYVATGATVPSLRLNNFNDFKVLLPKKELCFQYNEIAEKMNDEILLLKNKNKLLSKQRDMLLPRLMSGKLKV